MQAKIRSAVAVLALGLTLSAGSFAQGSNEVSRQQTKAALKHRRKVDKAQAKADKSEEKLAGSKQAKKAAKNQDKANATRIE